MRMTELKPLVAKALDASRKNVEEFHGVDHPQIRECYLKAQGAVDALEAVFDAINGNAVMLRARSWS